MSVSTKSHPGKVTEIILPFLKIKGYVTFNTGVAVSILIYGTFPSNTMYVYYTTITKK